MIVMLTKRVGAPHDPSWEDCPVPDGIHCISQLQQYFITARWAGVFRVVALITTDCVEGEHAHVYCEFEIVETKEYACIDH